MSDLNRQIAELLGWVEIPITGREQMESGGGWRKPNGTYIAELCYDTDANQIDAAVREWCCFDDGHRWMYYCQCLYKVLDIDSWKGSGYLPLVCMEHTLRATPEQKCIALLAAAEAMGEKK